MQTRFYTRANFLAIQASEGNHVKLIFVIELNVHAFDQAINDSNISGITWSHFICRF